MNTKKLRFSYIPETRLAGMSYPEMLRPADSVISYLKMQDISTLVNLTTSDYSSPDYHSAFDVIWEQVANMAAPSIEQVDRIYTAYCNLTSDEGMAIHCMHGLGRTGTVIACLLGRKRGMMAEEIIYEVRKARPGSIESKEQEAFIEFYLTQYSP